MKTGRNDPCPCGSGKKYKKCCLGKDSEAAARKPLPTAPPRDWLSAPPATPPAIAPPEPPPRPRDPATQRWRARWKEFESQDRAGRIAVFLKTLDDPEPMPDDLAFEMLNRLHQEAVTAGERPRFAEWVAMLRERRPEVFEVSAHYYLAWCLEDALAEGRTEAVRPLALELATHAGGELDTVSRSLEVLAYHGQLAILVEVMRIGWPGVKASSEIFPWAIHEFAETAAAYEIFDHLEHTAAPDPTDAALQERLKFFIEEPDQEFVHRFIADLTGQATPAWTVADFTLQPPRQKRGRDWDDDEEEETDQPDEGARNLDRLIVEFIGYLRRQEGVSYPKGQLARGELFDYFLRRHRNELDPRPSMLESALHPNRKLPKPPKPTHPLCPERVTLDVHLAGMVQFLNARHHRAAALFDIIPAWLRFLDARGLIDAETRAKVVADLRPLHVQVLKLWEGFRDDPTLYRAAQQWSADAAKAGPE